MNHPRSLATLIGIALLVAAAGAQQPPEEALRRIRLEATEKSAVFEYAFRLTDVSGPRLSGSPAFRRAAEWARGTLSAQQLDAVRFHDAVSSGWSEPGWSHQRYAVRLLAPDATELLAIPTPYSPSTKGRLVGEPMFFLLPGRSGVPVDEIIARFRGRVRDRILLVDDRSAPIPPSSTVPFRRFTTDDLLPLRSPAPPPPRPAPPAGPQLSQAEDDAQMQRLLGFLRDEGALAWLAPTRGDGGSMLATGPLGRPGLPITPPPGFTLPPESYNRIVRLMKAGIPARIEVELESTFHDTNGHTSVLAEIPGSSKKDEIVLVGAHLDSWHVGTGATDNAANCAIVIEAMRVLKTLGLPMARTIRMALWAAEERGLRGSRAYVRDFRQSRSERHYLYFNLDSGGGRIRGLQIQGRPEWLPVVDRWLTPFRASEQAYVSVRRTVGSDQAAFEEAGMPSMVLIQDPGFYGRTYHANVDVFDYLNESDLKESAVVLASLLWQAANE